MRESLFLPEEREPQYPRSPSLFWGWLHLVYDSALLKKSLYEACDTIKEIELYRNLVIHDGLLDDMPKVYKVVSNGVIIEKFILLPDRPPNGALEKYNNRNLFFSRDDKINVRLPSIISEFQIRQIETLKSIRRNLLSKL